MIKSSLLKLRYIPTAETEVEGEGSWIKNSTGEPSTTWKATSIF